VSYLKKVLSSRQLHRKREWIPWTMRPAKSKMQPRPGSWNGVDGLDGGRRHGEAEKEVMKYAFRPV